MLRVYKSDVLVKSAGEVLKDRFVVRYDDVNMDSDVSSVSNEYE